MIAICRALMVAVALWLVGTLGATAQTESDRELLRQAHSEASASSVRRSVPYGIEPGRTTLSPLYHATSSLLWVWENYVAPEVCAPGGYTTSNTAYYKLLWCDYGPLWALPLGFDRMVRNTKIGRATTPTNQRGLIEDDPKRYRQ